MVTLSVRVGTLDAANEPMTNQVSPPALIAYGQNLKTAIAQVPISPSLASGLALGDQVAYHQLLVAALSQMTQTFQIDLANPIHSVDGGGGTWIQIPGFSYELTSVATTAGQKYFVSVFHDAAQPLSCEYELTNDCNIDADGIALQLWHSRSKVLELKIIEPGGLVGPNLLANSQQMYFFRFLGKWRAGETLLLRAAYEGDPPSIRRTVCLTRGGPPFDPTRDQDVVGISTAGGLLATAPDWEQEYQERVASIAAPYVSEKQFFAELDRATSPPSPMLSNSVRKAVIRLGSYLQFRYRRRAYLTGKSQPDIGLTAVDEQHRADAMLIGQVLYPLFASHFPTQSLGPDRGAMWNAFALFADGELAAEGTHGAPNGVNYFSFAEFALLMVDLGERDWAALFWIFAGTAELFARSYHHNEAPKGTVVAFAPGAPRTSCNYRPEFNVRGARKFSSAEKSVVQQEWSSLKFEQARDSFGQLVAAALRDEFPGGPLASTFQLHDQLA